jgi:hypothetical protein
MALVECLVTLVAAWEHDTAAVNKLVLVRQALEPAVEQLVTLVAAKRQQPVLL